MTADINNLNPYAAPATVPETYARVRSGWLRGLIIVQAFVIVASLVIEAVDHETIVASGPVFSLVGLAIAVLAYSHQDKPAATFGASAIVLSLLIVFLINYNSWGPPQGDRPITILCFIYSAFVLPWAAWLVFRRVDSMGYESNPSSDNVGAF